MDFFDLHCDTLTECMDDGDSLLKNERDIDFERGSIFGRWNQVFAVFVPDSMDDSLVEGYFDSACNFYFDELKKKGDVFPILSSEDVRGHSRGVMLAMESSRGVGSLERLEKLYERGLRLITLTWNHKNRAAGGCDEGAAIRARAKNNADAQPGDKVVVESSTKKLLGVVALVYLLPVVGFLLGYFLTEGLMTENWRYVTALAAAALFFLPSVFYDRHARKNESLTYTILRLF